MLAKTDDPYQSWWYEQPDPLHFLRKDESKSDPGSSCSDRCKDGCNVAAI
jgi:hypothetical protein